MAGVIASIALTHEGWQGWVGLDDLLHTEVAGPPTDGDPSQYESGPTQSNFIDQDQSATTKPHATPTVTNQLD